MTTETQYTAEDFARAIAELTEPDGFEFDGDKITLAALTIAQRVMTEGVIEGALARHEAGDAYEEAVGEVRFPGYADEAAAIRAALTREETT